MPIKKAMPEQLQVPENLSLANHIATERNNIYDPTRGYRNSWSVPKITKIY